MVYGGALFSGSYMSGEYSALLRRRALSMPQLADRLLNEGEYDLAALHAEYVAQLYLKSPLFRLTGEEWRGHNARMLIGLLAYTLEEKGLRALADEVMDFAKRNKRILAELEEAHTRSVYGPFQYSRDQATALLHAARSVVELAKRIEKSVFGDRD